MILVVTVMMVTPASNMYLRLSQLTAPGIALLADPTEAGWWQKEFVARLLRIAHELEILNDAKLEEAESLSHSDCQGVFRPDRFWSGSGVFRDHLLQGSTVFGEGSSVFIDCYGTWCKVQEVPL